MISYWIYPIMSDRTMLNFKRVAPSEIVIQKVCKVFDLQVSEVFDKTRKRNIVEARQMITYVLRFENGITFEAIARLFNQNHATAIHGCNLIIDRLQINDKETTKKLENVKKELEYYMQSVWDRNNNRQIKEVV